MPLARCAICHMKVQQLNWVSRCYLDTTICALLVGSAVRSYRAVARPDLGETMRVCAESHISRKEIVGRYLTNMLESMQQWENMASNYGGSAFRVES